jgi:NAD(P)-dependent dehydrogenase (short-subunit alcohol dehydrogenase family)
MRALVVGASGGIGAALVARLRSEGAEVTGLSRRSDGLDVTDDASVAAVLGALEGPYDLIFVATGALELDGVGPEKSLRGLTAQAMLRQFALNAMGPALVLKHAVRLMPRDRVARFAALSARVGSIGDNGLGGWYSYRAAKAALNQFIHTGAIEVARSHPKAVVVALHPGHVATPLSLKYGGALPAVTPEEAAGNLLRVLDGLTPEASGGFFDWAGKPIPW